MEVEEGAEGNFCFGVCVGFDGGVVGLRGLSAQGRGVGSAVEV